MFTRTPTRLRTRLLTLIVLLLLLVMGSSLWFVSWSDARITESRLRDDLVVGERVFVRLLDQKREQLLQAARVLAADFGLRAAVASVDRDTIVSTLQNHGARIRAGEMMVIDLRGTVLASTREHMREQFPFTDLFLAAQEKGDASAIVLLDDTPYQLVLVPMYAPVQIAWIAVGFPLDQQNSDELANLTGLRVSLYSLRANIPTLHHSTLPVEQQSALLPLLTEHRGNNKERDMILLDEVFMTRVVSLDHNGELFAVLQRSLQVALQPFRQLQRLLVIVGLIGLAVGVLGAILLARNLVEPLERLNAVAAEIGAGAYDKSVPVERRDEIGELATQFNTMREAIAAREQRISQLAYFDTLTSLPNRTQFQTALDDALQEQSPVAVLLFDMDRFQIVNDTLGHDVGDQLLCAIADRLRRLLPLSMMLARMGGDEYAVLLQAARPNDGEQCARLLLASLEEAFVIGEHTIDVRTSIGVALSPQHGSDALALIRAADAAMFVAKQSRSGFAVFDAKRMLFQQQHLSLLSELRHAIDNNELRLYVQPKVALAVQQIMHAEVLVRWQHPQRGFIAPGDFIPFAEQTGFIKHITRWVIDASVDVIQAWQAEQRAIYLAVNLSTRDLVDTQFVAHVRAALQRSRITPSLLCLEVTESGFLDDPEHALRTLQELHGLGVKLSIDDFGTGYSSLAYLKRMPVQELKIDRGFVMNMLHSKEDATIVKATIDLGHNLALQVVAEGVENEAIAVELHALGCDFAQGYHYAKPMPVNELSNFISAFNRRHTAPQARGNVNQN